MSSAILEGQVVINESTINDVREMNLSENASLKISQADGKPIPVSKDVEALLLQALHSIAESGEFTVSRMPEELSSTTAADFLGISRPTLMKWAKEGAIPSHKVKSHTRFRREDVLKFKAQREAEKDKAFRDLREFNDQNDDLFDD
ncbi:helix-turn-helix domain-containing protein [Corynebacterium lubricantis]|uniref:helix-turn-helix domain-containing protein n=1 Tax=Corynebacterium lubricantis TaxID=541095 RepID=UPI00036D4275|nr:helix-turn-helix domain-containing protein [Corynebacterium lubricantis]